MNTIPLSRGFEAIVGDEDADLSAFRWFANRSGKGRFYACRNVKNPSGKSRQKIIKMHRVIAERMGILIAGLEVDHINGNPLDNRRDNLRVASRAQNSANRPASVTNKLKIKGVVRHGNKYRAQLVVNYKNVLRASFDTPEEAHRAYR